MIDRAAVACRICQRPADRVRAQWKARWRVVGHGNLLGGIAVVHDVRLGEVDRNATCAGVSDRDWLEGSGDVRGGRVGDPIESGRACDVSTGVGGIEADERVAEREPTRRGCRDNGDRGTALIDHAFGHDRHVRLTGVGGFDDDRRTRSDHRRRPIDDPHVLPSPANGPRHVGRRPEHELWTERERVGECDRRRRGRVQPSLHARHGIEVVTNRGRRQRNLRCVAAQHDVRLPERQDRWGRIDNAREGGGSRGEHTERCGDHRAPAVCRAPSPSGDPDRGPIRIGVGAETVGQRVNSDGVERLQSLVRSADGRRAATGSVVNRLNAFGLVECVVGPQRVGRRRRNARARGDGVCNFCCGQRSIVRGQRDNVARHAADPTTAPRLRDDAARMRNARAQDSVDVQAYSRPVVGRDDVRPVGRRQRTARANALLAARRANLELNVTCDERQSNRTSFRVEDAAGGPADPRSKPGRDRELARVDRRTEQGDELVGSEAKRNGVGGSA